MCTYTIYAHKMYKCVIILGLTDTVSTCSFRLATVTIVDEREFNVATAPARNVRSLAKFVVLRSKIVTYCRKALKVKNNEIYLSDISFQIFLHHGKVVNILPKVSVH